MGTGRSLQVEDVDAIYALGIPSISCNRIDLMYRHTKWRPDYYIMDSGSKNPNWKESARIHAEMPCECWYREEFVLKMPELKNKVITYPNCACRELNTTHQHFIEWCDAKPICGASHSMGIAAQIADYHDYDVLYLVGCDEVYMPHQPSHFDILYNPEGYDAYTAIENFIGLRRVRDVALMEYGKRGKTIIDLTFRTDWRAYGVDLAIRPETDPLHWSRSI